MKTGFIGLSRMGHTSSPSAATGINAKAKSR